MERKSAQLFSNCPWEQGSNVDMQPLGQYNQPLMQESVAKAGDGAVTAFEETRGGMPKAYIPNFFYRPPFGYPRYEDLAYQRQLAESVYVDMVEQAIIDQITSFDWTIVAEDGDGNETVGKEAEVDVVNKFFENPNTNPGESWDKIVSAMLPDLLEINSGIMIKVFNSFGKMVEIVARDGASFTKNPDVYGMFTNRADLILMKDIYDPDPQATQIENPYPLINGYLTSDQAREEGAYFQYGFNTGARPVPFGKREIIWFEKKVRTNKMYGRSSMSVLAKTVQTLTYAVEHNLEYFSDNSIPPGILGLDGLNTEDLKAFGKQWAESQKVKDDLGNWKKKFHKLAMVNRKATFEKLGYTNAELELIESQKFWSKLVWGAFGLTATDLGFTEDAKGSANQIVQTSVAKKRIIYPLLKIIEYYVNTQIIPEFGFKGIRYKYKIFDVDEETKKWGLYKLQIETGKTINEIRSTEGLDPVEWGDEAPKSVNQGNNININGDPNQQAADKINNDSQSTRDKMTSKPKDKKALGIESPLIPGSNEVMTDRKLKRSIQTILDENKKKVIEILESQTKSDPIHEIKGIDDIPKMIKDLFSVAGLKALVDKIIGKEFMQGWDKSEKQIDENVPVNTPAIEFLQDYTFQNIKDMTEEIANDLRSELSRGIINGEGITKLTARVNKVFDSGKNRAEMIARTETNRADNQGKLLAMKGSGIEMKKKWITHEDDRTSAICNRLDGQTVPLDADFKDSTTGWEGQAPPSHVNCRSTIVFVEVEE